MEMCETKPIRGGDAGGGACGALRMGRGGRTAILRNEANSRGAELAASGWLGWTYGRVGLETGGEEQSQKAVVGGR